MLRHTLRIGNAAEEHAECDDTSTLFLYRTYPTQKTDPPSTYKAVVVRKANGPFDLQDVDLQHPSKGEILVRVLACGLCYTDIHAISGHLGDIFPRVPGHEIIGEVVELGSGVTNFQLGERIGGAFHAGHDSNCGQCQRGNFQQCDHQEINGVSRDGGLAEYVLLRAEAAVHVPQGIEPAEAAPLLCAGLTVFNGIRKQHIEQGALVAVQGLGGLGHLAVQYARKMGYEVAVLSSGDDKAAFARELGAHHYINTKSSDVSSELFKLGGADLIVQTAPSPEAFENLLGGLGSGGTLLALAPVGKAKVNTDNLILKGQKLHGWLTGGPLDAEEAIKFAIQQNVRCMVEKYKLKDVQNAVDNLLAGKLRFRNVLVME